MHLITPLASAWRTGWSRWSTLRGVRLSPWVWFGSLVGEMQSATMERYPDLISAGVTVRWCCPECKEVMYVKKEELMSHLNECVK